MCAPLYLMCISCKPASVGEYCTVTVPSRLSVMVGWVDLPEGMNTSPDVEEKDVKHVCQVYPIIFINDRYITCVFKSNNVALLSPVISPFLKEKGITTSNGLKPLPLTLLPTGSKLSAVTWTRQAV